MISLWEILVPTVHPVTLKSIRTRFHRVWDHKVKEISGGLSILKPLKGMWVNPDTKDTETERMIPVKISCTKEQIIKIIDMTIVYYAQHTVMAYKISEEVIFRTREEIDHVKKTRPDTKGNT